MVPHKSFGISQLGQLGLVKYLTKLIATPPRHILAGFGADVGDGPAEQWMAVVVISGVLLSVTMVLYCLFTAMFCNVRRRRSTRADSDAGAPLHQEVLWTVLNKRYDLRDFVKRHPGGSYAIKLGQGRNCTEMFMMHHSLANEKRVRATLALYYVEDVPPEAVDYNSPFHWEQTPFFDALKVRVRQHFEQKNSWCGHRADATQWAQMLICSIASGFALRGFLRGEVLSMLLLPIFYWLGPSACMHDGSHFTLSRVGWINQLVGHIGAAHVSLFSWSHQHIVGHHQHTNIVGCDPDLYHMALKADSVLSGFRSSIEMRPLPKVSYSGVPRKDWWFRGLWQRPLVSTLGESLLFDAASLVNPFFETAFLGIVPYTNLTMWGLLCHSGGRAIVLWLGIVHPIMACFMTSSNFISAIFFAILFVAYPWCMHGSLFYMFTQFSHIQRECFHVKPDEPKVGEEGSSFRENGQLSREWAAHMVLHAFDYAITSRLWLHLSIGLNLQVVHHLFPQVAFCHYTELTPIVQELCHEFGVKYSSVPTFWDAMVSHYRHLKDVNDGPEGDVFLEPPERNAPRKALAFLSQLEASEEAELKKQLRSERYYPVSKHVIPNRSKRFETWGSPVGDDA